MMLSAFQARKARLQPPDDVPGDRNSTPSPSGSDSEVKPTHPTKRKPRHMVHNNNRQRKKSYDVAKTTRYFNANDGFQAQESFVAVDPDDDFSMSELDDYHISKATDISTRTTARAWSPSQPIQDSSEDELEEESAIQTEIDDLRPIAPDKRPVLSSFIPQENVNTFQLSAEEILGLSEGRSTVLLIPVSESIAFIGVYSLTILKGSISVCGLEMGPSKTAHRIFAPRSSPIPALEPIANIAGSDDLLDDLPQRVKKVIVDSHVVLLLQELKTGIEGLGRVMRTFEHVFRPSPLQRTPPIHNLGIPGVHTCSHQDRDIQPFILPNDWADAMSRFCSKFQRKDGSAVDDLKPIICLVKGPKNTGKSTFAKILVNQLTTRYRKVAFLDCDLGQSEFMPSGFVTLNVISEPIFGQPFTHPSIPHASHFIGSTTPRNSPSHYLTAIQALIQTYRLDIQYPIYETDDGDSRIFDTIPLVTNTMGWTKGLGADLNTQIEALIEPTDVFELGCSAPESFPWFSPPSPTTKWKDADRTAYMLSSIAPTVPSTRYTPAECRALSTLSYFHAKSLSCEITRSCPQWETGLPLCALPPYEIDIKTAFDLVALVVNGMEDVVHSEIDRVLNGALVALVEDRNDFSNDRRKLSPSAVPYTQGSLPPSPLNSNCIGLGFIRSISPAKIHMITPVPPRLLARCRILIKGEVELPVWGMLDFRSENDESVAGVERSKVPYLRWGKGEELGGEKKRVRRNLMRRGQL